MVAFVLLLTFALAALVAIVLRVAGARSPPGDPSQALQRPHRTSAEARVPDASRRALRSQSAKGLLLGLIVSPLIGLPIAAFLFQHLTFGMVALSAWALGPYVYAVIATQRGPRSRAWAIGVVIGHSLAIALLWVAAVKFMEGLEVGIGGG